MLAIAVWMLDRPVPPMFGAYGMARAIVGLITVQVAVGASLLMGTGVGRW